MNIVEEKELKIRIINIIIKRRKRNFFMRICVCMYLRVCVVSRIV